MAAGAVIGALRVVLGADTAALETGLKSAGKSISNFGTSFKNAGLLLSGAMAGVVGGVAVLVKGAIDEADKLGKMAQSIGLPVEELSKLNYAADLSGVSLEQLGTSVGKLSRNMADVAGGGTGPASQAFKALGIEVKNTDGTLKSSSQVIDEVATKFKGYEDGASKTAIAIALFGKAGASMIPLLNQGASGLALMKQEAEQLGIVISQRTFVAAENFNDNLTRLGKVKDGIILKITEHLLPGLESLSTTMVQVGKDAALLAGVASFLSGTVKAMASIVIIAAVSFETMARAAAASSEIMSLATSLQFAKAAEAGKKFLSDTEKVAQTSAEHVKNLWADVPQIQIDMTALDNVNKGVIAIGENWGKVAAPIVTSSAVANKAAAELEAAQKKILDAGKATFEATRTPLETYALELQKIQQQYEAGAFGTDTYARAIAKAAEDAGASWGTAGESMAGSFETIAKSFGKENSKMAAAAKIFGAIQAVISMFTGAAKALELPFPANIAAVAKVLATGASFVASIKSQKVPAMKTGGSFIVPGSGGPDSKRMQLDLTPGERVDVWRPNDGGLDPRGGAQVSTVQVSMQGEVFTRDTLRTVLEKINDMRRDGYHLELAPS